MHEFANLVKMKSHTQSATQLKGHPRGSIPCFESCTANKYGNDRQQDPEYNPLHDVYSVINPAMISCLRTDLGLGLGLGLGLATCPSASWDTGGGTTSNGMRRLTCDVSMYTRPLKIRRGTNVSLSNTRTTACTINKAQIKGISR